MTSFRPTPASERAYRDALGRFATGVAVVTTMTESGPVGITVNSFASVSLDPPLVLWSVDRDAERFEAFAAARASAIHVLQQGQRDLALHFARRDADFNGLPWEAGVTGAPLLTACLTRLECHRHAVHEGGDHLILVSEVTRVATMPGAPLIFAAGAFGAFSPSPD